MPNIVTSSNYSRSYYTLEELVDRVKGDLGYRNTNVVTSGDVTNWANEAQTTLARETKAFHLIVTSGTTSGVTEYPLPADSLGRAVSVEEVLYSGTPLIPIALNELSARDYWWRTRAAGTPQYYYLRGFSAIGLYPCPDTTDSDTLTVVITATPPQVTAPEDFFYIPTGCDDALIVYCKLMASIKDGYGEGKSRIDFFTREWERCKQEAKQTVGEVAQEEHLRMGENAAFGYECLSPFWVSPNTVATAL